MSPVIDKYARPTKLLWVDLEMTGLDPEKDVILEIAAEITDFNFTTLASYQSLVKQPKEVVEDRMQKNSWWSEYPENRDTFIANLGAAKPSEEVASDMVHLITEQFGGESAILAGNSIHNDRNFIRYWWPEFEAKLHYRMLDVSSFKVLVQGKYDDIFQKQEVHRALDDIQASIEELRYYLKHVNY